MSMGFNQNEVIEIVSDQDMVVNQTQKVDGCANKYNPDVEVNAPLPKETTPEERVEFEDCEFEFLNEDEHRFDIPKLNQKFKTVRTKRDSVGAWPDGAWMNI
ncbi:hypothetical protein V6N13_088330 [Hibiscus sabdariffa]